MSNDRIHSFADDLATYVLMKAGIAVVPVDLEHIAFQYGVRAIERRAIAAEGYVEPMEGGYRVVLRSDRSPQRTRFSLAHEIGHVLMDKLSGAPETSIGRRYRTDTSISNKRDEEFIADALAGAILIPPFAVSRILPKRFSIKGVARLAELTDTSTPTALLRAMWYATQPCFAFHLRWYSGKPSSLKPMWVHSSRSFRTISLDRVLEVLGEGFAQSILSNSASVFGEYLVDNGVVHRIEFRRSRYYEKESVYGIAFASPGWKDLLFNSDELDAIYDSAMDVASGNGNY